MNSTNNKKVYTRIIIGLIVLIVFLVILLFMSDSGKYCTPIVKEQQQIPDKFLEKDSLKK